MSSFDRAGFIRRCIFTAATATAVLAPMVAISGLLGRESERAAAYPPQPPQPPQYVLRCWQDGRLILEELHLRLPPGIDLAHAKLQLIDRNSQPLYVAETRNATCLVRARTPERPRSELP